MASITEQIKAFLNDDSGFGFGYSFGSGFGSGFGDGYSFGSVFGDSSGFGSGFGDVSGFGSSFDDGSGFGDGFCSGDGYGRKSLNNQDIYIVDGVPTIITALFDNYAKGFIVGNDFTLKPCYIAKSGGVFAHGKTLREAVIAMQDKLFEDMPEEERIAAFIESHDYEGIYENTDLYDWHHRLTGSCEMGRQQFATDHGIDLDGKMSIKEFIKLTKNAYGGDVIKKLEKEYRKGR